MTRPQHLSVDEGTALTDRNVSPRWWGTFFLSPWRLRLWLCTPAVLLYVLCAVPSAESSGPSETELLFIEQLLDRRLFLQAEEFCDLRILSETAADDQADWLLSQILCRRERAWFLTTADRNSLLHHTAEQITEFVRLHQVTPSRELMLRLRQAELLIVIARTQLLLEKAEDLYRLPAADRSPKLSPALSVRQTPETVDNGILRTPATGVTDSGRASASTSFISLIETARRQLETIPAQTAQIRQQLDSADARIISESAKIDQAECTVLLSQCVSSAESAAAFAAEADQLLLQLIRSSTDAEHRFMTRKLAAELHLTSERPELFTLRLNDLMSSAVSDAQKAAAYSLQVRGLLHQGRATDGLALLNSEEVRTLPADPQLQCLRLCCILGIAELQDALNRVDDFEVSAAQFLTEEQAVLSGVQGFWFEHAERTGKRFRRVQQLGVKAERLLTEVDRYQSEGRNEEARSTVQAMLSQLSAETRPAVRAAMYLKAGEISLRLKNWSEAESLLNEASTIFLKSHDSNAAAADLLRVFALGKLWEQTPNESHRAVLEAALTDHIRQFASAGTANTASTWLTRLHRLSHPESAVQEMLAACESLDAANRLRLLGDAADTLVELTHASSPDLPLPDHLRHLVNRFLQHLRTAAGDAGPVSNDSVSVAKAKDEQDDSDILLRLRLNGALLQMLFPESQPVDWESQHLMLAELHAMAMAGEGAKPSPALSGQSDPRKPFQAGPGKASDVPGVSQLITDDQNDRNPVSAVSQLRMLQAVSGIRSGRDAAMVGGLLMDLQPLSPRERLACAEFLQRFWHQQSSSAADLTLMTASLRLISDQIAVADTLTAIRLLRITVPAEVRTHRSELTATVVSGLPCKELTDRQLEEIALIFQPLLYSAADNKAPDGPGVAGGQVPGTSRAAANSGMSAAALKFWKTVSEGSRQGSDRWMESSLLTSGLLLQNGEHRQSARILDVVEVLYPDWGSPERLQRAQKLRALLPKEKQ